MVTVNGKLLKYWMDAEGKMVMIMIIAVVTVKMLVIIASRAMNDDCQKVRFRLVMMEMIVVMLVIVIVDGDGDDDAEQNLLYSYSVHHSCRIFDMEQTSSNHQIAKLQRWISEQRISGSRCGNHHHHQ